MEPTAAAALIQTLLGLGPSGVLAFVVWVLWRKAEALVLKIESERDAHMNTLRAQIEDKGKTVTDYQAFAGVLKELAVIVRRGRDADTP